MSVPPSKKYKTAMNQQFMQTQNFDDGEFVIIEHKEFKTCCGKEGF